MILTTLKTSGKQCPLCRRKFTAKRHFLFGGSNRVPTPKEHFPRVWETREDIYFQVCGRCKQDLHTGHHYDRYAKYCRENFGTLNIYVATWYKKPEKLSRKAKYNARSRVLNKFWHPKRYKRK